MFEKIDIKDLAIKPFELIGDQWMLITSGSLKSHNTMTASWGGVGIMWFNPVLTIYVRPQRFLTNQIISQQAFMTASLNRFCSFVEQNPGGKLINPRRPGLFLKNSENPLLLSKQNLSWCVKSNMFSKLVLTVLQIQKLQTLRIKTAIFILCILQKLLRHIEKNEKIKQST